MFLVSKQINKENVSEVSQEMVASMGEPMKSGRWRPPLVQQYKSPTVGSNRIGMLFVAWTAVTMSVSRCRCERSGNLRDGMRCEKHVGNRLRTANTASADDCPRG